MTKHYVSKLVVFLLLSALLAAGMTLVLGNTTFTARRTYQAAFLNVSGLKAGSPVRIAGVPVGKVTSVSIFRGNQVRVSFDVNSDITLTSRTQAVVRYKNLIGDRYLELDGNGGTPLAAGGWIPASRTSPALDLDTLLNGFKPLFAGLDPAQINRLSTEIIQVLQGQSGTVTALLESVASLTSTLADRDKLIGAVIDNLNAVLGTVSSHSDDLDAVIVQLQTLVSGLAAERDPIGVALVHINDLTTTTADLLRQLRPDLAASVTQLGRVSKTLNANSDTLTFVLSHLPDGYRRLARGGSYGNFFNFYLCAIRFKLTGPTGQPIFTPFTTSDQARCQ